MVYEEHEWLVGDGTAYINTDIKLVESDTIEIKIKNTNIPSSDETFYLVYGNNSGSYNCVTYVLFYLGHMEIRPTKTQSSNAKLLSGGLSEHTLVQTSTSITYDGRVVWEGESSFLEIDTKCALFTSFTDSVHKYKGNVAYFRILGKLSLVPCRLLRSIPAALDANGIARDAGECGMWDKVGNKFYGNVASTGRFTVLNN